MRKLLTLLTLFCAFAGAGAHTASAQRLPPRDYEDRGACPFECCTYRDWTVKADTVFYRTRSAKARAAYRAKKGERVKGLTGVVVTIEPGRAIATGDVTIRREDGREVRVKKGDVLYLLHSIGEGFFKVWFRGRLYEAQPESDAEHAARPSETAARPYLRLLSRPRTVWWVKVRNSRGQIGWSRQDDHFGDMDACG
jgi:hypothetical protein